MKLSYRRLHPTKEGKRIYRLSTIEIVVTKLVGDLAKHPDCDFYDKKGVRRAWIRSGYLYISINYSWNGCSPKRYIGFYPLGKWVGTPDFFEETIIPSLVHDVLYQFAAVGKYSFTAANYQFLVMMQERKFKLATVYHDVVEEFGYSYWGKDQDGVYAKYIDLQP